MATRRETWIVLVAAVAVGVCVRLPGIATESLWLDELVSWWIVSADGWGEMIGTRVFDYSATPPLYFVLARLSVEALGKSELALRLPSLAAGVLTILSLYAIGTRLFSARAGAIAALLAALSPHQILYSQDARPYELTVLLGLWAVYLLVRYAHTGRRVLLVGHGLAMVGALYSHYVCLALFVFIGPYFVLWWLNSARARRPAFGWWCLTEVLVLGAFTPGILAMARMWSNRGELAYVAKAPTVAEAFVFLQPPWLAISLGVLVLVLAPFGRWVGRRLTVAAPPDTRASLVAVALWFLVPTVAFWLVAMGPSATMFHVRYRLMLGAPCLLMLGYLFALVRPAPIGYAWAVLCAGLALGASPGVDVSVPRFSDHGLYEDWRHAAAVVARETKPGDPVLLRSGLVEAEFLVKTPEDKRRAGTVCSPLGDFYLAEPRACIGLPRDLKPSAVYDKYFTERVIPAIAGRERVLTVIRIDDVGGFSNTYYREQLEQRIRRLGGPRLTPTKVLQNGAILFVRHRVDAPATQPTR